LKLVSKISAAIIMALALQKASAVDLTLDNQTVNAGSTTQINVIWSSTTGLNFLTTEFIITAVGGAPTGEVTFTNTAGDPAMPPFNASNYVFFGDSFAFINAPTVNPASVTTTSWTDDTYIMTDASNTGNDVTQDGTKLWTILNITIGAGASGQYQITSGSSSYDSGVSTGLVPTITGGLITINAVPEPSTYVLGVIAAGSLGYIARRRKQKSE
jgi:hypothetical protein